VSSNQVESSCFASSWSRKLRILIYILHWRVNKDPGSYKIRSAKGGVVSEIIGRNKVLLNKITTKESVNSIARSLATRITSQQVCVGFGDLDSPLRSISNELADDSGRLKPPLRLVKQGCV